MSRGPVSLSWATRVIRSSKAEDLQRVLKRSSFRSPEIFDVAMERCEAIINENPRSGLVVASHLVEFSADLGPSCWALGLAVKGSALRHLSRYSEARNTYEMSLRICEEDSVRGKVLQRFGVLEMFEQNYLKAREMFDESIGLLGNRGDKAVSLILRSKVFVLEGKYSESAKDAGCALKGLDPRKDERYYLSAVLSIGDSVVGGIGSIEGLRDVLRLICTVRKSARGSGAGRYRSVGWIYLDWVEAQINGRLGCHRQAIRQLERVSASLFESGGEYFRDGLLAAVDLVACIEESGSGKEAKTKCLEVYDLAKKLGFETEALIIQAYLSKDWVGGLEKELRGITRSS